jgi:hypothetical protein
MLRRGVEGQAGTEQIKVGNIAGDTAALHLNLRRRFLGQAIGDPDARVGQHGFQFLLEGRQSAFRKDEAVHERGADDADGDFLDPGDGGVEYGAGREHARKADQGRRIARQHEHI